MATSADDADGVWQALSAGGTLSAAVEASVLSGLVRVYVPVGSAADADDAPPSETDATLVGGYRAVHEPWRVALALILDAYDGVMPSAMRCRSLWMPASRRSRRAVTSACSYSLVPSRSPTFR